jgi:hypothetical protein
MRTTEVVTTLRHTTMGFSPLLGRMDEERQEMITLEVRGVERIIRKAGRMGVNIDRQLRAGMLRATIAVRSAVIPHVPVGVSGRLKGSIGSSIEGSGRSLVGRVGSSLKDEVYPAAVELGTKPHFPPPSALVRWVEVILRPEPWKVYSVAFNIARKIARYGTRPRGYMRQGFLESKSKVRQIFKDVRRKIVEAWNNGT